MGRSIREYLLQELGVEESKSLTNVSKYIRANTQMSDREKCECCVCKVKSKQMYPKKSGTEKIYNHHVMKVEYLAILSDRFHMCYSIKEGGNPNKYRPGDYTYAKGFRPYSPRVAVCDLHHTMFHELVGDNELEKVYNIKLDEAKNLIEVFEEFNDEIRESNTPKEKDSEDMFNYKIRYQGIWDETILRSLTRLSYTLKITQLKSISDEYKMFYKETDFDEYQKLLDHIDEVLEEVNAYDEKGNVKLPEVNMFSLDELERFEKELSSFTIKSDIHKDDYLYNETQEKKQIKTEIDNEEIKLEKKSNQKTYEEKEEIFDKIYDLILKSNDIDLDDEELIDEIYDEISDLYDEVNDDTYEEIEV